MSGLDLWGGGVAVILIILPIGVLSATFNLPMFTAGIKKRSRVPGVMITQFIETLPEGKSHPDFTRKPIALTIQEGGTDRRGFLQNFSLTGNSSFIIGHHQHDALPMTLSQQKQGPLLPKN